MNTPTSNNPNPDTAEDAVARLIRLAGPRPVPPPDVREETLAVAESAWRSKVQARRQRRFAYAFAATAAGLALLFALVRFGPQEAGEAPVAVAFAEIVSGTVRMRDEPEAPWRPVAAGDPVSGAGTEVLTEADGGLALRLAGGESFRVGAETAVTMESAGRIRLAEGTVYLDSGSRDVGPSRVEVVTPAGTVRHLGTQYEVRYGQGDLRLRVREGRVLLEHLVGDLRAQAGDEVSLDDSGRVMLSTIERYGAHWDWVQALSVLPEADERSLASLLEWVERETGRQVHYARPGLKRRAAQTMLHGDARGMLPMEALAVMLQTTDFHYTITGDEEILIEERGF